MSLGRGLLFLTVALGVVWCGVCGVVCWPRGAASIQAVTWAAAVCWVGGVLALLTTWWGQHHGQAISGALAGTALRIFIPAAVATGLSSLSAELSAAGISGFFVLFYLAALAVDTVLAVKMIGAGCSRKGSLSAADSAGLVGTAGAESVRLQ